MFIVSFAKRFTFIFTKRFVHELIVKVSAISLTVQSSVSADKNVLVNMVF